MVQMMDTGVILECASSFSWKGASAWDQCRDFSIRAKGLHINDVLHVAIQTGDISCSRALRSASVGNLLHFGSRGVERRQANWMPTRPTPSSGPSSDPRRGGLLHIRVGRLSASSLWLLSGGSRAPRSGASAFRVFQSLACETCHDHPLWADEDLSVCLSTIHHRIMAGHHRPIGIGEAAVNAVPWEASGLRSIVMFTAFLCLQGTLC